jgi:phosphoglycerate dehydrogenase-like enzyme
VLGLNQNHIFLLNNGTINQVSVMMMMMMMGFLLARNLNQSYAQVLAKGPIRGKQCRTHLK